MDRVILHCDMNNFYASVECRLDPSLAGKPVAVCGDETTRHNVVVAKNYEAKAFGVATGDIAWQARGKCPQLILVRPHFEAYREYSQKAREIYLRYTEFVESMGLDECWLDVTALTPERSGREIADELRRTVKNELGLTISVGVSFSKTFAKLGSDLKKPDAVTVITRDNYRSIVWPLSVESIIGIGDASKNKLNRIGIRHIGELAAAGEDFLAHYMGKHGAALWQAANGICDDTVRSIHENRLPKSISHGTTTTADLTTENEVFAIIRTLTGEIEQKLAQHGLWAGGLALTVRNNRFEDKQFQTILATPLRGAAEIADAACSLFRESYTITLPIRMITVSAIRLVGEGEPYQMQLEMG